MTKEEFIEQYFTNSGFTEEDKKQWLEKMEAKPCNCGEPECQGWGFFAIGIKQRVNNSSFHFFNFKVPPPPIGYDGKEHIFIFNNEGCTELKLDMEEPGEKEVIWYSPHNRPR